LRPNVGGWLRPGGPRSAYDLPSASAGSGQTVAIVDAFDDPDAESDLATYRSPAPGYDRTLDLGVFWVFAPFGGESAA